jgi:hypothetical protein
VKIALMGQIRKYLCSDLAFKPGLGVFEIYDSNQLFRHENVG